MNKPTKISAGLAMAFATVLLAGCGGDGDNGGTPSPTPAPPPPAAATDPTVTLVRQLVAQGGSDTAEPIVLSSTPFPTNDTAEPDTI